MEGQGNSIITSQRLRYSEKSIHASCSLRKEDSWEVSTNFFAGTWKSLPLVTTSYPWLQGFTMRDTPPYTRKFHCVRRVDTVFLTTLTILTFPDNTNSQRRSFPWPQAASAPYRKLGTWSYLDKKLILPSPLLRTSKTGVEHWDSEATFCLTCAPKSLQSFVKACYLHISAYCKHW